MQESQWRDSNEWFWPLGGLRRSPHVEHHLGIHLRQLLVYAPGHNRLRTLGRRPLLGFAATGIFDRIEADQLGHVGNLPADGGSAVTAMLQSAYAAIRFRTRCASPANPARNSSVHRSQP